MKFIIPFLIALLPFTADAQIDTEFWFGAPDLTMGTPSEILSGNRRDSTVVVVFTSFNEATQIQILQPANLSFAPIIIDLPANSTASRDLGEFLSLIETKPANEILNTGLLIRSTRPITAYYEIDSEGSNTDIFSLKGKNSLGTKFYTPFQTIYQNNQTLGTGIYIPPPRSGFIVMATNDNTTVTITPSIDILGHDGGVPFSIVLDRGQTYYCEAIDGAPGSKPAGSLVESDKPITVTTKDDMIDLDPSNDGGADVAGDQLIAEEYLGTKHIVVRGGLTNNADRIVVCATVDDTELFIDGSLDPILIDEGMQYEYAFSGPVSYLTSSEKVSVFHISGFGDQLAGAIIPSLDCTGSNQVGFVRSLNAPFYLTLTIRAGSEDSFVLNGNASLVPASAFNIVPGSNGEYVYARISFTPSQVPVNVANLITNFGDELFHLGITNGNSSSKCNYGYFSAFSFLNIGENAEVCIGDSVLLDAGPGKTSYLWSTGEETQSIYATSPGTYAVEVFSGSECSATDTIFVSYYEPPIDLGINDTICDGTSLTLAVEGNYLFNWQDGSNQNSFTVTEEGFYWLEVSDFQQCVLRDSIYIGVSPRPETPDITGELSYCQGETATLTMGNVENASYRYILPDGTLVFGQTLTIQNIQSENSGLYQGYFVVDGCETFNDSVNIVVNPVPVFDLGESESVCLGETILIESGISGVTYLWQDGSTEPDFLAIETGTFTLTVTTPDGCSSTESIIHEFRPLPLLPEISGEENLCAGETLILNTPAQTGADFFWFYPLGETITSLPTLEITNIQENQAGIYTLYVDLNGCISETTSFTVNVNNNPEFTLAADTTLCTGDQIEITGPEGFASYLWSTGETTQSITAGVGNYQLTVADAFGCAGTASTQIFENAPEADFTIAPSDVVSPGIMVSFTNTSEDGAGPINTWLWQFGDGGSSANENTSRQYEQAGVFTVSLLVTDEFGCTSTIAKEVIVRFSFEIPEGFSPNNDGRNDVFEILGLEGLAGTTVQIFNRWGAMIFESNDYRPGNFWDGKDSPVGTYFYIVTLPDDQVLKGNLTLAR